MKKNRILAILILCMFILTLSGCGGQEPPKSDQTSKEKTEATKPAFPEKPITYVVQAAAGGSSDVFVRKLCQIMEDNKIVDKRFVVQAMPGGSGAVAYNYVKEKAGDPYTIANTTSVFIATGLNTKNWTTSDFAPIARLAVEPPVVVVDAKLPYNTLKDLVEDAKANPGKVKWAGAQTGTKNQILSVMVAKAGGCEFTYIPFEADSEALAAVLGGHADVATCNARDIIQHAEAGSIKILGVSGEERLQMIPDVPTIKEAGYDVVLIESRGVIAPKEIPAEAEEALSELFRKMTETDDWKQYLEDTSLQNGYLPSKEFSAFLVEEEQFWKNILTELGFLK